MILELVVNVAGTGELARGLTPAGRVRCAVGEIGRNGVSGEEPDVDRLACPFRGVDSSTVGVEAISKAVGVATANRTANIVALSCSIDIAIRGFELSRELTGVGDAATSVRMQSHVVDRLGVDAFNDIDFSIVGPIGPQQPKRWPCTTGTCGHMCEVDNEEAVVVRFFAAYPYAVPTTTGGSI